MEDHPSAVYSVKLRLQKGERGGGKNRREMKGGEGRKRKRKRGEREKGRKGFRRHEGLPSFAVELIIDCVFAATKRRDRGGFHTHTYTHTHTPSECWPCTLLTLRRFPRGSFPRSSFLGVSRCRDNREKETKESKRKERKGKKRSGWPRVVARENETSGAKLKRGEGGGGGVVGERRK